MWQALNPGDRVSEGDFLRYRSISNQLVESEVYLVAKTDQHYFEVVKKADCDGGYSLPPRKLVRYIDIGYNIRLERWWDETMTIAVS